LVHLPGGCGGEPSIAVAPDGTVLVAGRGDSCADLAGPVATWVSRDGGRTFSPRTGAGPSQIGNYDSDVVLDGRTGYLAQGGGLATSFCRTEDAGASWQALTGGPCSDGRPQALLVDRPWVLAASGTAYASWLTTLPPQNPAVGTKTGAVPTWFRVAGGTLVPLPPVATAGSVLGTGLELARHGRPALGAGTSLLQPLVLGATTAPQQPALDEPRCRLVAVRLAPGASAWTGQVLRDTCATSNSGGSFAGFPVAAADGHGRAVVVQIADGVVGTPARSGTVPYVAWSHDDGTTWTTATAVPTSGRTALPGAVVSRGRAYAGWYLQVGPQRWDYVVVRLREGAPPQELGRAKRVALGPEVSCVTCPPNDLSSLAISGTTLLAAYLDADGGNTVLRVPLEG
jgi:hypothetical protein